jgi:hypothetical protein
MELWLASCLGPKNTTTEFQRSDRFSRLLSCTHNPAPTSVLKFQESLYSKSRRVNNSADETSPDACGPPLDRLRRRDVAQKAHPVIFSSGSDAEFHRCVGDVRLGLSRGFHRF